MQTNSIEYWRSKQCPDSQQLLIFQIRRLSFTEEYTVRKNGSPIKEFKRNYKTELKVYNCLREYVCAIDLKMTFLPCIS